ncbi:nickel-dependent lactate racemase family protein [Zavarzinella formosa]|uniref:lactate racemase domain-containing protein n=1 Tax=Zavarzinella formosa TaxID=360055 RepID=UPI00030943EB|nr:lactate racemase domain-containing protein [Zavarzinella formosa]
MSLPVLHRVLQTAPQPTITDVAGEVRRQWLSSRLIKRVKPGDRIAIGCGSRGIRHIDVIAKATVDVFLELGTKPFIVAAMGSHGGATADGQRELLAEYGITEKNLGVPVKTEMETEQIGVNSWGDPVWWDRNAVAADGVVALARIKPHTDYRGPLESGIAKMCVIGLGKRDGANQHHRWGWKGLQQMLPESAKVIIEKTKFLGGLGILENANEETAHLQVVDRDELMTVEPGLLDRAKAMIGTIPFDEIDVLIIGELGKNYSGAGIDPNVVGRLLIEAAPELETNRPKVTRMVVLDVSPESHGNATGVGIADLTTNRLIAAIDPIPFRMNNLTACFLRRSQIPFAFETDAETIGMAIQTCWQPIAEKLKVVIIPNTLEVSEMWVSAPLAALARQKADLKVSDEAIPIPFDSKGNIEQEKLFPHSVRGRRKKAH